jgi:SAM-dependent methyltransferase
VDGLSLDKADTDYFDRGEVENARFWSRLGGRPDFRDAHVVDVGCGHGSLCVDIAQSGARQVIGLDLDIRRIQFAQENLELNFSQLVGTVEYRTQDLREAPEMAVDYFVSKDTLEHITGLDEVLEEMRRRLRPGGRVYAGFGPLWNSPFGDHGRGGLVLPWAHTMVAERTLVEWRNRFHAPAVESIQELGLNGLSLAQYLQIFRSSGMKLVSLNINASGRMVSRLFSAIRAIPPLREYFSHNIYCVLEKQGEQ